MSILLIQIHFGGNECDRRFQNWRQCLKRNGEFQRSDFYAGVFSCWTFKLIKDYPNDGGELCFGLSPRPMVSLACETAREFGGNARVHWDRLVLSLMRQQAWLGFESHGVSTAWGPLHGGQLVGAYHYRMTLSISLGIPAVLCWCPLFLDSNPEVTLVSVVGGIVVLFISIASSALVVGFSSGHRSLSMC